MCVLFVLLMSALLAGMRDGRHTLGGGGGAKSLLWDVIWRPEAYRNGSELTANAVWASDGTPVFRGARHGI